MMQIEQVAQLLDKIQLSFVSIFVLIIFLEVQRNNQQWLDQA